MVVDIQLVLRLQTQHNVIRLVRLLEPSLNQYISTLLSLSQSLLIALLLNYYRSLILVEDSSKTRSHMYSFVFYSFRFSPAPSPGDRYVSLVCVHLMGHSSNKLTNTKSNALLLCLLLLLFNGYCSLTALNSPCGCICTQTNSSTKLIRKIVNKNLNNIYSNNNNRWQSATSNK